MQEESRTHPLNAYGGWLLAAVALVLRLAYIWVAKSNPTFWAPSLDPQWYDEAARVFANGSLGELPFFRAPLYPALLGSLYYFLGHNFFIARILNALLQSMAVWMLFIIGRTYFSSLVAWIAAGLLALNGLAIYFSAEILTTSLEIFAVICALWATLRALSKPGMGTSLLCGVVWGIAAIARPNFLIIVPLVFYFLWRSRSVFLLRRLALLILGVMLPIAPVTMTNVIGGGEFVLIATQGGVNFWIGNNPQASGIVSSLPGIGPNWTMQDAREIAAQEAGRQLKPGELSDFYYGKARSWIVEHPLSEAKLQLRKTLFFFSRFEVSNNKHLAHFLHLAPWLPFLCQFGFGLLIPLSLLGAWVSRKRLPAVFLSGYALFYLVSVILYFVAARFRMPVVPALCILSALAIEWAWQTFRRPAKWRGTAPLLILVPGIALTLFNPWGLREASESQAYFMEGNAYMQLKEPQKAEASFRKALMDTSKFPLARVNLGVLAYERGDFQTAENEYRQALAEDSLCVEAWNNLGMIQEIQGDTATAVSAYKRALSIRPYMTDAQTNLAGLYFRQGTRALREGRNEEAVWAFRENIALLPNRPTAHYNLAVALGRLGMQDKALRELDTALALDPTLEPARELKTRMEQAP
jgi:Flp pilus assembly protein TadD/4-amino-4-deoxy-L-arabinose transferase-like glycosyltransferase